MRYTPLATAVGVGLGDGVVYLLKQTSGSAGSAHGRWHTWYRLAVLVGSLGGITFTEWNPDILYGMSSASLALLGSTTTYAMASGTGAAAYGQTAQPCSACGQTASDGHVVRSQNGQVRALRIPMAARAPRG